MRYDPSHWLLADAPYVSAPFLVSKHLSPLICYHAAPTVRPPDLGESDVLALTTIGLFSRGDGVMMLAL